MIERYEHHGRKVAVDVQLRGRHKEHCLCYTCKSFHPEDREQNCPLANVVYRLCVLTGMTLPVWECPEYETGMIESFDTIEEFLETL